MKPKISEFGPIKFVGLRTRIRESLESQNDMSQVSALWQKLIGLVTSVHQRIGHERYVLITGDLPKSREPEAYYYALIAVKDFENVPESLLKYELPKKRRARFVHKGLPQTLSKTARFVFFEWLPASNESVGDNLELFIYPKDYDRTDPNGEFEYCLFLLDSFVKISAINRF